jgi:hypothetical protein
MALIYSANPPAPIDEHDYAKFVAFWNNQTFTEALQLAYADRLAERARLLRKAILNRVVVNEAADVYEEEEAEIDPPLIGPWNTVTVTNAARACFKAANNDL